MVITRAMGRHLRSYPHARFPDHEDLLRHPLLDDHLSKGNSEAYPRGGVCELCVIFSLLFVLSCIGDLTIRFYFWAFILSCYCLTVKSAGI